MSSVLQCPNCTWWFTSSFGLCHHIRACHTKQDVNSHVDDDSERHHPIQSMHLLHKTDVSLLPRKRKFNRNDSDTSKSNQFDNGILFDLPNFNNTSTTDSNLSYDESSSSTFDDTSYDRSKHETGDNYTDHATHVMEASTTLQIRLNELINNHKASLKLHDDIVDIFNDYISLPTVLSLEDLLPFSRTNGVLYEVSQIGKSRL